MRDDGERSVLYVVFGWMIRRNYALFVMRRRKSRLSDSSA